MEEGGLPGGGHSGGSGGTAGNGGIVIVSDTAKVYAYNGNKYTDGTDYEQGKNQLEIYGQNGIVNKKWNVDSAQWNKVVFTVESEASSIEKSGYINKLDSKIYGVGCGAGYYEKSNGIYKEVNNENIDETYKSLIK